jgi:hypothetical protein
MDRKYALDANILISCNRRNYPFDIAPSFWIQLSEKGSDRIILIDKIQEEIYRSEDELTKWLKGVQASNPFFVATSKDIEIIYNYSKIISSVKSNNQYFESAKSEFASVGDSWLCAHAMTYDYVIVTEETFEASIRKKIKIPNVCKEFDIKYINLLQFMRELGIRFN